MKVKHLILPGILAVFVAGLLVGYGCQKEGPADKSAVVAKVGDAVLTVEDLERIDREQRRIKAPSYSYLPKEKLVDEWIRSEVVYQKSLEDKIDQDKEAAWRLHNLRKSVLIRRFWEITLFEKYPEASDADALAYYEKVRDKEYKTSVDAVCLRRGLFSSKETAEAALARVRGGEDFLAIVRKESVSPEKLEGGSQGYRRFSDYSPEIRALISGLKVGDIGGPLKQGPFWVLIRLEDRVPAGGYLKPEGIGMHLLKDKALAYRYETEMTRITDELEKSAKVERHPDRIPNDVLDMMPEGPSSLKAAPAAPPGGAKK